MLIIIDDDRFTFLLLFIRLNFRSLIENIKCERPLTLYLKDVKQKNKTSSISDQVYFNQT